VETAVRQPLTPALAPGPDLARGEVITFYSYKGGTGRSMALANVACLMAERLAPGDRILVVDWDLEAPGLHRFFPSRFAPDSLTTDLGLDGTPGLIDLMGAISDGLPPEHAASEEASEAAVHTALAGVALADFISETCVPGVAIMRSGRNEDGKYSRRVNTFNWEQLFLRAPTVYRSIADRLAGMFRYVLIDSRTGVSDISGICTSLLPEKLVVVFTPNRQSLTGVRELVDRAITYRRRSDDLRPLLVFPLPSRIEASLEDLRARWRFGSRDHGVIGYQPMFEQLLSGAYALSRCDLTGYFDQVQIQQTPDYAYGEEIAVRRGSDRLSVANSYRVFADRLLSGEPPWAASLTGASAPAALTTSTSGVLAAVAPADTANASVAGTGGARPGKVFISYAREDRDRVKELAEALRAAGLEVVWDDVFSAGTPYAEALTRELDSSDAIVVCWTPASVDSRWVQAEAEEGLRRGVLIPVLFEDVSPPLLFRSIRSADLRRGVSGALPQLVASIRRLVRATPGTVVTTPREPVRARRSRVALLVLVGAGVGLALAMAVGGYRPDEQVPAAANRPGRISAPPAGPFGLQDRPPSPAPGIERSRPPAANDGLSDSEIDAARASRKSRPKRAPRNSVPLPEFSRPFIEKL
jgi:cellulose biosynthesis protein BcsQ